jgi:hypothetical protein
MDDETQNTPRKQLAKHNSKYRGSENLNLPYTKYFCLCFGMELLKFGRVIEADGNKWK